jgi:hypothetical protein
MLKGKHMRVDIYLKSVSCDRSIAFYVEELGMFDLVNNFGTGFCTLRSKRLQNLNVFLGHGYNSPGSWPVLGLSIEDCYEELNRLRDIEFASGGGVVPNELGQLEVFEYPGGRNILLRDPDGHEIILFEDFGDPL